MTVQCRCAVFAVCQLAMAKVSVEQRGCATLGCRYIQCPDGSRKNMFARTPLCCAKHECLRKPVPQHRIHSIGVAAASACCGLHHASADFAFSSSVSQPSCTAWSLNAASSFGAFGWSSWMSPISDSTRLKPLRSWVCKMHHTPSECSGWTGSIPPSRTWPQRPDWACDTL